MMKTVMPMKIAGVSTVDLPVDAEFTEELRSEHESIAKKRVDSLMQENGYAHILESRTDVFHHTANSCPEGFIFNAYFGGSVADYHYANCSHDQYAVRVEVMALKAGEI